MDNNDGITYHSAPNSTSALISLICGILGLTLLPLVGSIVALIVGYMAKKDIRESNGTIGGDGLATTGIVLGWIGVGLTFVGCCIAGSIFALLGSACLVPLGINWDQFGSVLPLLTMII